MELRHLRYFVAIAEELNFTKAAKRMCTVQPSLSQQIKDLEHEVGVQLLVRTNRKVELTAEGQAFLKQALLSLEHAEQAIQDARKVAKKKDLELNIGFVPVAEMKVFPYIMPNIRAQFPDLNIQFHSQTDADQFKALKKGDLDIAFTRYVDESDDIEFVEIFREPLALIVPKDSPFAAQKSVSIKSFNQQNFVISDEGSSPQLYKIIQDFFKKSKLNVNVVQHSTNILLNVNLVGMGVGWSLVPAYVIPLLGDKIVVKNTIEPLPMIELYANYPKGQKNAAIDLILKVLKDQFHLGFN
ncbi:LysR substrate-binding domain-containing protein [Acinetobacter portensis]|uniref:LysR family transcriptional regulator n=3 Tax=Acinetobacter TaxID=469 RepID=A0A6L6GFC7_9GAMM|nr:MULTISPECIES: LysR substrate-binding domain-containing protein [Acinetobacter]MCK7608310.1 LysR substrate-binding domain-containing protein [Acinetobacter portensis]MCK7639070.1 LysR substrate-binding domain-containing protein [Acinetobacter portensis]MDY6450393.1 LysR substrate-binding domain-containing protein [Acinetobacter faecalis]MDY6456614.1 LysR substrate-binding domain-containing protein [Acinetobacter faecalis]MDY6460479.1 LysR substrate-binding domain-containing protein [Acinetob